MAGEAAPAVTSHRCEWRGQHPISGKWLQCRALAVVQRWGVSDSARREHEKEWFCATHDPHRQLEIMLASGVQCGAPGCGKLATKRACLSFSSEARAFVWPLTEFDVYHCDEHELWAHEEHKRAIRTVARRMNGRMKIGEAVDAMWRGLKVRRAGWNGKGMWIAIQSPDSKSKMTEPYVYMSTAQSGLIPWLCSQADLLADDWELAE